MDSEIEMSPEQFLLADLLRAIARDCLPVILKNGNRLEIDFRDDVGEVHTNRRILRLVVERMLQQSASFTRNGTITLRVRRPPDPTAGVVVEVQGTGQGTWREDMRMPFQPTSAKPQDSEGAQEEDRVAAIRFLGGGITATSELGRGLVFSFTIPVSTKG